MDPMARFHYFQEPDGLVPGIPAGNSSLDDCIGAIRLGVGARDPALADSRAAGAICSVSSFNAIWARTAFARARLAAFFAFLDARRASLNINLARQVLSFAALAFFSAVFTCSRAMRTFCSAFCAAVLRLVGFIKAVAESRCDSSGWPSW